MSLNFLTAFFILVFLAELFSQCLKNSCFPDCWKAASVVPVFKNVGEGLHLKTTILLVFFLWLVKYLKNL